MVYLELFHGRNNPNQNLDDWGEEGPVFGPLNWVHTTYRYHIKLGVPGHEGMAELFLFDDMIYYNGVYYGDWSIFSTDTFRSSANLRKRRVQYDHALSELPTGIATRVEVVT